MDNSEKEFKNRLIPDLEKEGLNILDLKSGVLDLFVDSGKRCFLELKVANRHYKPYSHDMGINLKTQTKIIKKMNNLPIVLACDEDNSNICYFISPEKLKEFTDKRVYCVSKKGNPYKILIGVHHLKDCTYTYGDVTKKVREYVMA